MFDRYTHDQRGPISTKRVIFNGKRGDAITLTQDRRRVACPLITSDLLGGSEMTGRVWIVIKNLIPYPHGRTIDIEARSDQEI
jgi:hypothetical protein